MRNKAGLLFVLAILLTPTFVSADYSSSNTVSGWNQNPSSVSSASASASANASAGQAQAGASAQAQSSSFWNNWWWNRPVHPQPAPQPTPRPVPQPAPTPHYNTPLIKNFSVDSATIQKGQSTTLRWEVADAKHCSVTPYYNGYVACYSARTITPNETTTYTLTALNGDKTSTRSVTVTVNQPVYTNPYPPVRYDDLPDNQGNQPWYFWDGWNWQWRDGGDSQNINTNFNSNYNSNINSNTNVNSVGWSNSDNWSWSNWW